MSDLFAAAVAALSQAQQAGLRKCPAAAKANFDPLTHTEPRGFTTHSMHVLNKLPTVFNLNAG
jgi:hypothetical protein